MVAICTHLDVVFKKDHDSSLVAMGTTVVGGGEDGGNVWKLVVDDSVVRVGKPHPILLALVGSDHPYQIISFEKGLHCRVAVEIGAPSRWVGHEVQLKELYAKEECMHQQISVSAQWKKV